MNFRQILLLCAITFSLPVFGQSDCGNPISINSIIVSNTTCTNSTGAIIITPAGGNAAFTFEWTPAVSTSNAATNLPAGTYQVHMVRANDPDCTLDTTIIVNNSNGPQAQAAIDPADCLAANGSVTMSPATLLYSWSTGAGTNVVQGLASGNYYVTATNPNTGCYSVQKVFVPRSFAFNISANVLQHAKCGRSIGRAQIVVAQGSGQYSYSLGAGPVFSNFAAGTYTCVVTDNVTGCQGDVTFTIENLPVSGTVDFDVTNIRCADGGTGQVDIDVIPGDNFRLPFIFTLVNSSGTPQSPGNLGVGTYYLQISDADLCSLPADTFTVTAPPPLVVTAQTTAETCLEGGTITLQISGGTGAQYTTNWLDVPGDVNPKDRSQLEAGLYSVIVYDSLFCTRQLDNLLVAPQCNQSDTIFMVVKVSSTDFYCWEAPAGLSGSATTYALTGGGTTGNSANGAWFLNTDGCLAYSAGPSAGFAVDTICVVRTAAQIGLKDTLCIVVTITAKQPTKQSVFFTVQTNQASAACGSIPAAFNNYTLAQIGRPGLTGNSGVYGTYQVNSGNGCLSFFANNIVGFSVDEIRVGVFDTVLNESHIICYLPTIVPAVDCASFVQLPDSLPLTITDCNGLALGCLPVPFDDIVNYTVIDNGVLYNSGFNGCDFEPSYSYNVASLPQGGGPYQLTEWLVNGQSLNGAFLNTAGLASLLNQLNPGQGWALQGNTFIRGGELTSSYGALKVRSATGVTASYEPMLQQVARGVELRFNPGSHQLIFRNVLNACADTVQVAVTCFDCLPVHSYPVNSQGNIVWNFSGNCAGDTLFCTNILTSDIGQYTVTDNQLPFNNFASCGPFVALRLDTGFHQLRLVNNLTTCQYNVPFYLTCQPNGPGEQIQIELEIGEQQTVCLDTTVLQGAISSVNDLCFDDSGGNIQSNVIDGQQWCITVTGLSLGLDTICLQLCNATGECANYTLYIAVTGAPSDSLLAVPDAVYTLINTDVDIPILANDIVRGIVGNRFALADVTILTQPLQGSFGFNAPTGVFTYSPDIDACGLDSVLYRITDSLGQQSEAYITVTVVCDKVLVFKGISPNGDGRNDVWHILGIEQFPGNEVQVYNRWGNQVFEQKGYTNTNAWDGTWNGKDLPDGTYFYILQLGGNNGTLEGYLQLLR